MVAPASNRSTHQPGLHSKTLSQTTKKPQNRENKKQNKTKVAGGEAQALPHHMSPS
jgi:hypothetical protein